MKSKLWLPAVFSALLLNSAVGQDTASTVTNSAKESVIKPQKLMLNKSDAAQPGEKAEKKNISTTEAKEHVGETLAVAGTIAQVTIREKLAYLNLDKKFPDSPLTCVVFASATNLFGDLKKLEGKQVEIKGKIEDYKGKPQIVLTSPNQLTVVEKSPEDSKQK